MLDSMNGNRTPNHAALFPDTAEFLPFYMKDFLKVFLSILIVFPFKAVCRHGLKAEQAERSIGRRVKRGQSSGRNGSDWYQSRLVDDYTETRYNSSPKGTPLSDIICRIHIVFVWMCLSHVTKAPPERVKKEPHLAVVHAFSLSTTLQAFFCRHKRTELPRRSSSHYPITTYMGRHFFKGCLAMRRGGGRYRKAHSSHFSALYFSSSSFLLFLSFFPSLSHKRLPRWPLLVIHWTRIHCSCLLLLLLCYRYVQLRRRMNVWAGHESTVRVVLRMVKNISSSGGWLEMSLSPSLLFMELTIRTYFRWNILYCPCVCLGFPFVI